MTERDINGHVIVLRDALKPAIRADREMTEAEQEIVIDAAFALLASFLVDLNRIANAQETIARMAMKQMNNLHIVEQGS